MNYRILRRIVIVGAAVVITVAGMAFGGGSGGGLGGGVGRTDDSELCQAYRAAERSWETDASSWDYDDFNDTEDIEKLASVAKRHADESVRSAGGSIDNLPMVFDYGEYSSAVAPIAWRC
ncbi:MAG TPA: hypothetical protein GX694_08180 [Actinomycetales bacterium]|nr:hypothetical protein [Actinomycetales bacterium]